MKSEILSRYERQASAVSDATIERAIGAANKSLKSVVPDFNCVVSSAHFINPFTLEAEPFTTESAAFHRMFAAAADRINKLEAELERVKSFLVVD